MIETILSFVNKYLSKITITNKYIPADKQMHLFTAAVGAALLYNVIGWFAVLVISITGVIKEWYDYRHPDKHTCDIWDWVATTIGGGIGAVLAFLIL